MALASGIIQSKQIGTLQPYSGWHSCRMKILANLLGAGACVGNVLLAGGDAVLGQREGGDVADGVHIRIAGLQLAVHLGQG